MNVKDLKNWKQHKIPAGYRVLVDNGDEVRVGRILATHVKEFGNRRLHGSIIVKSWAPLKARASGVVRVGDGVIWVITKH